MTSKTSLFNKSIFKNNIRRMWWGSLLYAILLILTMPMQISMQGLDYFEARYIAREVPSLFDSILYYGPFQLFNIGFLIIVPVLVALLLTRYLHAKKQVAMIHSLPVTRLSLFITNFLSGLTLMYLPILLNGLILLCYSAFGGYCIVMPMGSILLFVGLQLLFTALLFAVPMFFAMTTGNSILMVIFTYASYYLPVGLCTGVSFLMSWVLFGYKDDITFLTPLFEHIPMYRMLMTFGGQKGIDILELAILLSVMVALIVVAYLFYRKRNLETAGDAISFQWLKPVFKYLVTVCAFVVVATYATAVNPYSHPAKIVTLTLIGSFVAYFGSEMLMRKSFKVFGCYRGFLVFLAVVAIGAVSVKFDLFGYEKRIPEFDDIVSASFGTSQMVYSDAEELHLKVEGEVDDPETIRLIMNVHESIIAHKDELWPRNRYGDYKTVNYHLKNGSVFSRYYWIDPAVIADALKPLYESKAYKDAYFDVIRRFESTDFNGAEISGVNHYSADSDTSRELYRMILTDIDTLGYQDIDPDDKNVLFDIRFMKYSDEKNTVENSAAVEITPSFTNTIAFMKEKGIYQRILLQADTVEQIVVRASDGSTETITQREAVEKVVADYHRGIFTKDVTDESFGVYAIMVGGEKTFLGSSAAHPVTTIFADESNE